MIKLKYLRSSNDKEGFILMTVIAIILSIGVLMVGLLSANINKTRIVARESRRVVASIISDRVYNELAADSTNFNRFDGPHVVDSVTYTVDAEIDADETIHVDVSYPDA